VAGHRFGRPPLADCRWRGLGRGGIHAHTIRTDSWGSPGDVEAGDKSGSPAPECRWQRARAARRAGRGRSRTGRGVAARRR
jgi:hypothetical protein